MNTMRATNRYAALNKKALEKLVFNHTKVWNENTKSFAALDCVVFFKEEGVNPAAYFADNDVTVKFRPVYEISGSANNDSVAVTKGVSTMVCTNMMGNVSALNMHNKKCK